MYVYISCFYFMYRYRSLYMGMSGLTWHLHLGFAAFKCRCLKRLTSILMWNIQIWNFYSSHQALTYSLFSYKVIQALLIFSVLFSFYKSLLQGFQHKYHCNLTLIAVRESPPQENLSTNQKGCSRKLLIKMFRNAKFGKKVYW